MPGVPLVVPDDETVVAHQPGTEIGSRQIRAADTRNEHEQRQRCGQQPGMPPNRLADARRECACTCRHVCARKQPASMSGTATTAVAPGTTTPESLSAPP